MSEHKIQSTLYGYLGKRYITMIPNYSNPYEMDMCALTSSMYKIEFEIKCSYIDFKNDFKKSKHARFKEGGNYQSYPNYFYFVSTLDLIADIPTYAGFIRINYDENPALTIVKKAPILHKGKVDDKDIASLLRCMTYRYFKARYNGYSEQKIKDINICEQLN